MKRGGTLLNNCFVAMIAAALVFANPSWAADDQKDESDINKRIEKSAEVLSEIMGTPDKAIPDKVMADAKCFAVVPSMIKIAVGFGGNHGKGIATCRTENGWSAPAPITVTGGSFGLQLGGQRYRLIKPVAESEVVNASFSRRFDRQRRGQCKAECGLRWNFNLLVSG